MLNYRIAQMDANGTLLNEITVQATNYNSALRELSAVEDGCKIIVVYNEEGKKAGEVSASFWHQRIRRG